MVEFTFPNFSLALVRTYAEGANDVPFLHTHSMREQTVIVSAENALNGQEGTSYLPSDGVSGQIFDTHFEEVLGISRQSQWDAHVYDGAFMVALATLKATLNLENPGAVTGADIRDRLLELNAPSPGAEIIRPGADQFANAARAIAAGRSIDYEGASGPCEFDDWGRARNRIAHWLVEDQKVRNLAIYDCVEYDDCGPPR
jgi:hypothetical protein